MVEQVTTTTTDTTAQPHGLKGKLSQLKAKFHKHPTSPGYATGVPPPATSTAPMASTSTLPAASTAPIVPLSSATSATSAPVSSVLGQSTLPTTTTGTARTSTTSWTQMPTTQQQQQGYMTTQQQQPYTSYSTISSSGMPYQTMGTTTTEQQRPVLDRVEVMEHKQVIEKPIVQENIKQELIEVHEKPIQKQIMHPTQEVIVREPVQMQTEGREMAEMQRQRMLQDMYARDRQHPVQFHENMDLSVRQEQPTIVNVATQLDKEIVNVPIVTEIHEQPVREIHEQEIQKTVYEQPSFTVVRDQPRVETITSANPIGGLNQGMQNMNLGRPMSYSGQQQQQQFVQPTETRFMSGGSQQFRTAPPPPPGSMPLDYIPKRKLSAEEVNQLFYNFKEPTFQQQQQQIPYSTYSSGSELYSNQGHYSSVMDNLGLRSGSYGTQPMQSMQQPIQSQTILPQQQMQQPLQSQSTGQQLLGTASKLASSSGTSVPPPPGPMPESYSAMSK